MYTVIRTTRGGKEMEQNLSDVEKALELMRTNMLAKIMPDENAQRGIMEAFITLIFTS